jgi:hypothetical protein
MTLINATVRPVEFTVPVFSFINIFTYVFATIWPMKSTFPVHSILVPHARVLPAVRPIIISLSWYCVLQASSCKCRPVCILEHPVTVFLTVLVRPVIRWLIGPGLDSFSSLFIVDPLPVVICSIRMNIITFTMRVVFLPVSIIKTTVEMYHSTFARCHVILPESFVNGAVNPNLDSFTFTLVVAIPLPPVHDAFIHYERALLDKLFVVVCLILIIQLIEISTFQQCSFCAFVRPVRHLLQSFFCIETSFTELNCLLVCVFCYYKFFGHRDYLITQTSTQSTLFWLYFLHKWHILFLAQIGLRLNASCPRTQSIFYGSWIFIG